MLNGITTWEWSLVARESSRDFFASAAQQLRHSHLLMPLNFANHLITKLMIFAEVTTLRGFLNCPKKSSRREAPAPNPKGGCLSNQENRKKNLRRGADVDEMSGKDSSGKHLRCTGLASRRPIWLTHCCVQAARCRLGRAVQWLRPGRQWHHE